MRWSDIPFHPSRTMLRQFAWLWLAFFGGLSAYQGLGRGNTTAAAVLGVVALTVGPVGLIRPDWLRPIFVAWMVLAFPIGWTISLLMLGALYYLVFTPVALVFRLIGRDALRRSKGKAGASYWSPKPMPTDVRRYLKQF
jgi:hypothetical protein